MAHGTGVHECNTVPYARFALKKRHGFCAKAREKNMQRHRLGTLSGVKLCDVYNAALEHVGKQKADLQNSFVKNVG